MLKRTLLAVTALSTLGPICAGAHAAAPHKKVPAKAAGEYGEIKQDYLKPADLTQSAWNNPDLNKPSNQETPGYSRVDFRADRIIPLRLREAMTTTIRFPADEYIEDAFVSDPTAFESLIPRANVVMIRVIRPGADGNLTVMGKSGNIYQFYIRGEPSSTRLITDISVDVMVQNVVSRPQAGAGFPSNMGGISRSASASDLQVEADWLRSIGFKPENIVHDLSIYVPKDDSAGVVPQRVFRDNQYTYIDYGSNADAINEWPVASLLIQGSETPVNSRTAGPNGRMLVVEAVGDIVLRNGQKFVSIRQNKSPAMDHPPARKAPQATERVVEGQPVPPPSVRSPSTGKKYLVDLGGGDRSSMEKLWLTLKAQNSSVLGTSEASYPDANSIRTGGNLDVNAHPGDVRLRAGPFYGLVDGVRVCKLMTAAGRSCAVVSAN